MDKKRYRELNKTGDAPTKEEFDAGWHYCYEWDGLLINKYKDPEGECCHCLVD